MQVILSKLGKDSFSEFNVNLYIYFKPTEEGIKILKDNHDRLDKRIRSVGGTGLDSFKLNIDENGYCSMQMWSFMQIFGPHISLSSVLFETNVLFKTKDLRKKVF